MTLCGLFTNASWLKHQNNREDMMAKECNIDKNMESCNCTYEPCSRKGICCECIRYHWRMGELPACFFPDDVEKTFDRTIEKFIETYQTRGRWW